MVTVSYNNKYVCPLLFLGNTNAFFLCRKDGHVRKNFPIMLKSKSSFSSSNTKNNKVKDAYVIKDRKEPTKEIPALSSEMHKVSKDLCVKLDASQAVFKSPTKDESLVFTQEPFNPVMPTPSLESI